MTRYLATRLGAWLTISFGVLFGLVTLGLLGLETLGYLRSGTYTVVAQVQDIVVPFLSTRYAQWVIAPSDWLGLHAIVSAILRMPLWLPSGVLSAAFIGCGIHDLQWAPIYDASCGPREGRR